MADTDDFNWLGFTKTHYGTTIDTLSRYNDADIDPFTVQIGQAISEQFKINRYGQHNLAHIFASLPAKEFHDGTLGSGYGERHIVHLLTRTDSGFAFVGLCGALGEYFHEDFIVSFFMALAQRSKIPLKMAPAEYQWRRVVSACYGVLATSTFGITITRFVDLCPTNGSIEVNSLVDSLLSINSGKEVTISAGIELPWLAAMCEWFFDIGFRIQSSDSHTLFPPGAGDKTPQVTLQSKISNSPRSLSVTGGRVVWDTLFRSCFGKTFQDIDKDTLAGVIACASALTHRTITVTQKDSRTFFLTQASEIPGLSGHGLNETIMAWFPEIRRLASRVEKWKENSFDYFFSKFDEQMQTLQSVCMCNTCGNASDTSTDFCKVSLAQVVISIGLYISRMIVVPGLLPKKSGVLAFYERHHADRLSRKGQKFPNLEEDFIKAFSAILPTPLQMISTASLLFSGVPVTDLLPESLCIVHSGLVVATMNQKHLSDDPSTNPNAGIFISSGTNHFHERIYHQAIWDDGVSGITYAENFDIVRTKGNEIRQIAKPQGSMLLYSLIWLNKGDEEKAGAAGWYLV